MTRLIMTTLAVALICAPALAQTSTTTTAHAFNTTMTVNYDDGTSSTGSVAISGNETLTYGSSGQLLSGEFKFTATINGKTFTGTAKARIGSGRYYSGKFTCPETGITVRFSVLIGHPEGCAGSATFVAPHTGPHGFGYGTASFCVGVDGKVGKNANMMAALHTAMGIEGVLPVN